ILDVKLDYLQLAREYKEARLKVLRMYHDHVVELIERLGPRLPAPEQYATDEGKKTIMRQILIKACPLRLIDSGLETAASNFHPRTKIEEVDLVIYDFQPLIDESLQKYQAVLDQWDLERAQRSPVVLPEFTPEDSDDELSGGEANGNGRSDEEDAD